jgi:hypothetical protein
LALARLATRLRVSGAGDGPRRGGGCRTPAGTRRRPARLISLIPAARVYRYYRLSPNSRRERRCGVSAGGRYFSRRRRSLRWDAARSSGHTPTTRSCGTDTVSGATQSAVARAITTPSLNPPPLALRRSATFPIPSGRASNCPRRERASCVTFFGPREFSLTISGHSFGVRAPRVRWRMITWEHTSKYRLASTIDKCEQRPAPCQIIPRGFLGFFPAASAGEQRVYDRWFAATPGRPVSCPRLPRFARFSDPNLPGTGCFGLTSRRWGSARRSRCRAR